MINVGCAQNKRNSATPSSRLRKISQHRVRSTTQQCNEGVGGPMDDQQYVEMKTRRKEE